MLLIMRDIKLYLLLFLLPFGGMAQNWAPLGYGLEYAAFTLFADSIDNKLYVGGNFKYAFNSLEDTVVLVYGITAWDGNQYLALGQGNSEGNCYVICPPMRGITRFDNEVYADLQDVPSGSDTIYGIARWNGERWDSLQEGIKSTGGFAGKFYTTLEMEEGILIGGLFTQAGNIPADGLAKWDGDTWEAFDFPGVGSDNRICCLSRLGGDIYAAGNFSALTEEGETKDVVRFDGEKWHAVDGGIKGGLGHINAMLVFQEQLYVAVFFQKSAGNTGNKIMKLGPSGWQEVGGGIIGATADIHAMAIHNGALYVGGIFDWAGDGVPAQNFARWDGQQWCGFGNAFSDRVYAIESLNDSLYIAGWFGHIDGQRFNGIAKWVGGDFTANCGAINRTHAVVAESISIFPNPVSEVVYLQFDAPPGSSTTDPHGPVEVCIYAIMGRQAYSKTIREASLAQRLEVPVAGWPPGVYMVEVRSAGQISVQKFVVQ